MAREFRTVGVVGLGTMGAGIVEVFARNGLQVIAVEIDESSVAARPQPPRDVHHAGGRSRQAQLRGRRALLGRITTTTSLADLADADLVVEAVPESLDLKAQVFAELDKVCRPEVVLASNTSSLSVTELAVRTGRPGKVVGMHFFNPAPVQKLVEVRPHGRHRAGRRRRHRAFAATPGQGAGRHRRPGRVHRQRAALRLPQPRRADVRVALRQPRGPRRRHALRLRLPDGPAGAAGPDRAGHRLRDPRDDVRRVAQPACTRPRPVLQADDHGRAAGPEERPRLLHLRGPAQLEGRRRRARPRPAPCPTTSRVRDVARVGVVGTGTMASGIVEVFAERRPRRRRARAQRVQGRRRRSPGIRKALEKARGARQAHRGPSATRRWAAITGTTHLEDFADVDLVVEAIAEELDVKRAVFAALDEICKPGAILATTTSSLPVVECAAATSRPGRRHRHALLQPGAGDEARGGGLARSPRRPMWRRPSWRSASGSTRCR